MIGQCEQAFRNPPYYLTSLYSPPYQLFSVAPASVRVGCRFCAVWLLYSIVIMCRTLNLFKLLIPHDDSAKLFLKLFHCVLHCLYLELTEDRHKLYFTIMLKNLMVTFVRSEPPAILNVWRAYDQGWLGLNQLV